MLKNLWVKRGLKVICVIIVLVAVLHSISFAGNDVTNVNTEDSIKQTIESYIAAQLESVKYHDADKMNILNDLIDQETEMGKKTARAMFHNVYGVVLKVLIPVQSHIQ